MSLPRRRSLSLLAGICLLTACATPAERAARAERDMETMIRVYGPACEKLGFKNDTDLWRDCILRLNARDTMEYYQRLPSTTGCIGYGGGLFNCMRF